MSFLSTLLSRLNNKRKWKADMGTTNSSPFAGESRLLALVCVLGPALVALIPMAAAPSLPSMARQFNFAGDGQLFSQMVMTVPAMTLMLFSPLTGLIVERFGSRGCMLACLALYAVAGSSVLWVEDAYVLISLRLVLGIAGGGILSTSLTLIGNHFDGEPRERLLGYATAVSSLFAAVALIFGGLLVDSLGWRAPFGLYLLGVPVLLAAAQSIEPGLTREENDPVAAVAGHASLLPVWPYYALLVILTVGMFTPSIQGPFLMGARDISDASTQGLVMGATAVVAIFSAGFYGKLRKIVSAHGVLVIDAICMGSGLILLAHSTSVLGMLTGCSLVGVGAGMSEPAIASIVLERTPLFVHGLAMGLIVSALNSGQFVNPVMIGQLNSHFGLETSILLVGVFLTSLGLLIHFKSSEGRTTLSTG